ncbi:MAG: hypothetical protein M1813_004211 [Trichoglossum hirsutum]|nr:MAG: hypothetical protein M1813_004211 [Trichoglossum hirsutum]
MSSSLKATSTTASTSQITFAPAFPMPFVFDVEERLQQLHSYLEPGNPMYQPEPQHINIKAAINLYKEGKIDGLQRVYIMNGEVSTEEAALNAMTWVWTEDYDYYEVTE